MTADGTAEPPVEPSDFEVARRVEDLPEDQHPDTVELRVPPSGVRERRRIRIPQLPVVIVLVAVLGTATVKLAFEGRPVVTPPPQRLADVAPPSAAPAPVPRVKGKVVRKDARKKGDGDRRRGRRRHVTIALGGKSRGNGGDRTRTIVVQAAPAPASGGSGSRQSATKDKPRPEPQPTLPLFHLHNDESGDHYFTTSESDRNEMLRYGYDVFAIEGYVFADPVKGLTAAVNADNGPAGYVYAKEREDARPLYYLRSDKYGDFFTSDAAMRDAWVKSGFDWYGTVGWIG